MSRLYIFWDARACADMGTDNANVIEGPMDKEAAEAITSDLAGTGAVYSYKDNGGKLTDERWEWDVG